MKKLALAVSILAISAVGASAADLAPRYVKAPSVAVTAYDWSGFYIGANAGYGWGTSDPSTTTEYTPTNYWHVLSVPQVNAAGIGRVNPNGFVGGAQAGYNWQASNFVFGVEVDFDSFNLRGARTAGAVYDCCAPFSFMMTQAVSTDWLFTARGRLGWAANNWLFYGTGGVALTNLKHGSIFADTSGAAENVNDTVTKAGWVAGAGIEYGIDRNWTVRAEYLHVDFGSVSSISCLGPAAVAGPACTRMFHSADLKADIARVGVNYKFGGPVVAKY